MIINMSSGGAGALLIKVVGGLTRPENPTYGTLWLETEVPINGWEIFSVVPTWEHVEGHVYLQDAPSTSGEIPNFSVINAEKKPYGFIWERLIGAFQRINGTWVRLNGAMWRDGVWTPFFSATINITYPVGSTCTVTDGVTTLIAPDTSGTWACVVPNGGTWTITSILTTETVDVFYGQSIDINVSRIYLIKDGNTCDSITGGWSTNYYNDRIDITASKYSGYINLSYQSHVWSQGLYSTNNNIDLSKIKTVCIECYQNATPDTTSHPIIGTFLSVYSSPRGSSYDARVSLAPSIGKKAVISLPVDHISSSLRVRIGGQTGKAMTITVYNVWVEA